MNTLSSRELSPTPSHPDDTPILNTPHSFDKKYPVGYISRSLPFPTTPPLPANFCSNQLLVALASALVFYIFHFYHQDTNKFTVVPLRYLQEATGHAKSNIQGQNKTQAKQEKDEN